MIFGGVGSGLYGMLMLVIVAVFVGGLMVGRTPEYLGKKIEAREIKMAVIGSIWVPVVVLILTAIAMTTHAGKESIFNAGPHGFTEAFYAYTSQTNNNGSAFAGYTARHRLLAPTAARRDAGRPFRPAASSALAIGGSVAVKKITPPSLGTMRTDGPTFVVLLTGVVILLPALTILPGDVLGPVVEALTNEAVLDAARPAQTSSLAIVIVIVTVVLGIVYPAVMAGVAQLAFPNQANGSLISRRPHGRIRWPPRRSPAAYFHPRPSATGPAYNADGTTFATSVPTARRWRP